MDENEPRSEWTPEEQEVFRRALGVRRQRQIRAGQVLVGLLIAVVTLGVLLRISPAWWVPAVGLVAVAALAFRFANWKCPACGEGLPTRGAGRVCPGCGLPLE